MAETTTRVEIGFDGGLILTMRLDDEAWAALRGALERGEGRVNVTSEETGYVVDVSKVSYVRHERHVGRIGF